MMLRSVLFPQPEGPEIETDSPAAIERSTPLRTRVSVPSGVTYDFVTPRSSIRAGMPPYGTGLQRNHPV
jgi:hypothetical protein